MGGWGLHKIVLFSGSGTVRSVVKPHKYMPKMYMKLMLPPASAVFFP
jgi:hypothetical protein